MSTIPSLVRRFSGHAGATVAKMNALQHAKSPYLRQHMSNPVDWNEWKPAVLQRAREENKPIFLSIGYSACHWCHVMERESFENARVADVLNEAYVSIKVDREERPDLDDIYMASGASLLRAANAQAFVQATTGAGGWPLNLFLTPELKPIFGGTYFPGPDAASTGRPGFLDICQRVAELWRDDAARCRRSADSMMSQLEALGIQDNLSAPDAWGAALPSALAHLQQTFDARRGGFGSAPKFPSPLSLSLLHRVAANVDPAIPRAAQEQALDMATQTLQAIWLGALHDHVGHGFARYSVTAEWTLPHFEKMLYDQALLLTAFTENWKLTRSPESRAAAYDCAYYLTRDALHAPGGAFYASQDADSHASALDAEMREGAYYVWTRDEFDELLGADAPLAAAYWHVDAQGNIDARYDAHGDLAGQNTLWCTKRKGVDELAREFQKSPEQVRKTLEQCRVNLREWREAGRPQPRVDDKIVVAWNGLAIAGLASAGRAFAEDEFVARAADAANFIKAHMSNQATGRLHRIYREGAGDEVAFAEDYAFLIKGLIELYHASLDEQWLEWATRLQDVQDALFWDTERGGYFTTEAGAQDIVLRRKSDADTAEPSANAQAIENLLRLHALVGRDEWRVQARQALECFGSALERAPAALACMAGSVPLVQRGMGQIVVSGDADAMLDALRDEFLPQYVIIRARGAGWLAEANAHVRELARAGAGAEAQAYVCRDFACHAPVASPEALLESVRRR